MRPSPKSPKLFADAPPFVPHAPSSSGPVWATGLAPALRCRLGAENDMTKPSLAATELAKLFAAHWGPLGTLEAMGGFTDGVPAARDRFYGTASVSTALAGAVATELTAVLRTKAGSFSDARVHVDKIYNFYKDALASYAKTTHIQPINPYVCCDADADGHVHKLFSETNPQRGVWDWHLRCVFCNGRSALREDGRAVTYVELCCESRHVSCITCYVTNLGATTRCPDWRCAGTDEARGLPFPPFLPPAWTGEMRRCIAQEVGNFWRHGSGCVHTHVFGNEIRAPHGTFYSWLTPRPLPAVASDRPFYGTSTALAAQSYSEDAAWPNKLHREKASAALKAERERDFFQQQHLAQLDSQLAAEAHAAFLAADARLAAAAAAAVADVQRLLDAPTPALFEDDPMPPAAAAAAAAEAEADPVTPQRPSTVRTVPGAPYVRRREPRVSPSVRLGAKPLATTLEQQWVLQAKRTPWQTTATMRDIEAAAAAEYAAGQRAVAAPAPAPAPAPVAAAAAAVPSLPFGTQIPFGDCWPHEEELYSKAASESEGDAPAPAAAAAPGGVKRVRSSYKKVAEVAALLEGAPDSPAWVDPTAARVVAAHRLANPDRAPRRVTRRTTEQTSTINQLRALAHAAAAYVIDSDASAEL